MLLNPAYSETKEGNDRSPNHRYKSRGDSEFHIFSERPSSAAPGRGRDRCPRSGISIWRDRGWVFAARVCSLYCFVAFPLQEMGFDPDRMDRVIGFRSNPKFDLSKAVLIETLYSFVFFLEIFKDGL